MAACSITWSFDTPTAAAAVAGAVAVATAAAAAAAASAAAAGSAGNAAPEAATSSEKFPALDVAAATMAQLPSRTIGNRVPRFMLAMCG
eukprot:CAMPEP_0168420202 /NCGR_PEP_ID=MMETSP0228-20121227/32653_1 /TAXON_ID=133427 /ORGANISM="Protoceratium reticulatum, Strain CCCM 535 (=CCMP 1889)" /LENGTH=88 /DNA_ID=CAMNT_0008434089 /DNA_START=559 /DNA_END=825 /DNA_ORIENTATION=+